MRYPEKIVIQMCQLEDEVQITKTIMLENQSHLNETNETIFHSARISDENLSHIIDMLE
jgi:hypothetical protein